MEAQEGPKSWPLDFVRAVNRYSRSGKWPATENRLLTLRETDRTDKLSIGAGADAKIEPLPPRSRHRDLDAIG
jgi:hypothetical protein